MYLENISSHPIREIYQSMEKNTGYQLPLCVVYGWCRVGLSIQLIQVNYFILELRVLGQTDMLIASW